MSMVLYFAPFSSATPVCTALRELDVPHEAVEFDLKRGDQHTPEHLARNPNGRVPTLVVDGAPMFETLAIMHFLGERYGVAQGMWPKADTAERRTALSWTTWAYVDFGTAVRLLNLATSDYTPQELHSEALTAYAHKDLDRLLGVLDGHLSKHGHIVDENYSLADLVVANVVLYARICGAHVDAYGHVKKWVDAIAARPAIRAAWS